jgi:hypothetical protein
MVLNTMAWLPTLGARSGMKSLLYAVPTMDKERRVCLIFTLAIRIVIPV